MTTAYVVYVAAMINHVFIFVLVVFSTGLLRKVLGKGQESLKKLQFCAESLEVMLENWAIFVLFELSVIR